jgi:superfamily I DNA/RNA helicase
MHSKRAVRWTDEQSTILNDKNLSTHKLIASTAGSGKTTVGTQWVANAVAEGLLQKDEILCISFTRVAGSRIAASTNAKLNDILTNLPRAKRKLDHCDTLHALSKRILKKYKVLHTKDDLYIIDEYILLFLLWLQSSDKNAIEFVKKIKFVLIDEVQDCNELQIAVGKLFSKTACVMAFGEDVQSIFGFQGSDVRFIRKFDTIFTPCVCYHLSYNFRCSKPIVDLANMVLDCGKKEEYVQKPPAVSYESLMQPVPNSPLPRLLHYSKMWEVVKQTVDLIATGLQEKKVTPDEVFILCRNRYLSFQVQAELAKRNIRSVFLNHIKDTSKNAMRAGMVKIVRNNNVVMGTIHNSKAEEAEWVFLLTLHADYFPDKKELDVEKERRLFYVGITRAKTRLFLWNFFDKPSLFVRELYDKMETRPGGIHSLFETAVSSLPVFEEEGANSSAAGSSDEEGDDDSDKDLQFEGVNEGDTDSKRNAILASAARAAEGMSRQTVTKYMNAYIQKRRPNAVSGCGGMVMEPRSNSPPRVQSDIASFMVKKRAFTSVKSEPSDDFESAAAAGASSSSSSNTNDTFLWEGAHKKCSSPKHVKHEENTAERSSSDVDKNVESEEDAAADAAAAAEEAEEEKEAQWSKLLSDTELPVDKWISNLNACSYYHLRKHVLHNGFKPIVDAIPAHCRVKHGSDTIELKNGKVKQKTKLDVFHTAPFFQYNCMDYASRNYITCFALRLIQEMRAEQQEQHNKSMQTTLNNYFTSGTGHGGGAAAAAAAAATPLSHASSASAADALSERKTSIHNEVSLYAVESGSTTLVLGSLQDSAQESKNNDKDAESDAIADELDNAGDDDDEEEDDDDEDEDDEDDDASSGAHAMEISAEEEKILMEAEHTPRSVRKRKTYDIHVSRQNASDDDDEHDDNEDDNTVTSSDRSDEESGHEGMVTSRKKSRNTAGVSIAPMNKGPKLHVVPLEYNYPPAKLCYSQVHQRGQEIPKSFRGAISKSYGIYQNRANHWENILRPIYITSTAEALRNGFMTVATCVPGAKTIDRYMPIFNEMERVFFDLLTNSKYTYNMSNCTDWDCITWFHLAKSPYECEHIIMGDRMILWSANTSEYGDFPVELIFKALVLFCLYYFKHKEQARYSGVTSKKKTKLPVALRWIQIYHIMGRKLCNLDLQSWTMHNEYLEYIASCDRAVYNLL